MHMANISGIWRVYGVRYLAAGFVLMLAVTCGAVIQAAPVRQTREILGWQVHVDQRLLNENQPATEEALRLLAGQLEDLVEQVPAAAVARLREVPLYVSPPYPGFGERAEYHPDAGWLGRNGRDPAMAKGIEFTNVDSFEAECRRMPALVLHELAHAYHDRVLPGGHGNATVKEAFERARASGRYEQVERRDANGNTRLDRAYALTNPAEYFAETSEAFFSTNDFFPYVRDELEQVDPRACVMLASLWGVEEEDTAVDDDASQQAVTDLGNFLDAGGRLEEVEDQAWARVSLTAADATAGKDRLVAARLKGVGEERRAEREAEVLVESTLRMPFGVRIYGEAPADGHSLFISLHGGGNAPAAVNDSQWQNQQRLYEPAEGVYVAPRAPTDTWNLWHEAHIDRFLDRLIDVMAVTEGINRNRVYLLGYSAGGDGVYQLAPRMADRFAAAAMMAGHPNDASPLALRNLPFALLVGGRDAAYDRNTIAADWERQLDALQRDDPGGYEHFVKIFPEHGHWMQREDAVALPWMASYTRNPTPKKVVWVQDDVTHPGLYWLAVAGEQERPRTKLIAAVEGQRIRLDSADLSRVTVLLDDRLVDLDQPVTVVANGTAQRPRLLRRTLATLARTLADRAEPDLTFSASVEVPLVAAGE
jgi:predicted esterase